MNDEFSEEVYLTAVGGLIQEATVPGVMQLFQPDGPGCKLLEEAGAARDRLQEKYSMEEEDRDMDTLIDSLWDISQLIGVEMYRCGALFGPGEAFVRREGIHSAFSPIGPDCQSKQCTRLWRRAMLFMSDEEFEAFFRKIKPL